MSLESSVRKSKCCWTQCKEMKWFHKITILFLAQTFYESECAQYLNKMWVIIIMEWLYYRCGSPTIVKLDRIGVLGRCVCLCRVQRGVPLGSRITCVTPELRYEVWADFECACVIFPCRQYIAGYSYILWICYSACALWMVTLNIQQPTTS